MRKAYGTRRRAYLSLTQAEARKLLAVLRSPIEEMGHGRFKTQCPACNSATLSLRCHFYDSPYLSPALRCRGCSATEEAITNRLRVAVVVAGVRQAESVTSAGRPQSRFDQEVLP